MKIPRLIHSHSVYVLLLFLACFARSAQSDELRTFVRPLCMPEVSYFEVITTPIWNEEPDLKSAAPLLRKKYSLFPGAAGKFSCDMGPTKVRVRWASAPAAGLCGKNDGGTRILINLWINDGQVLKDVVLSDDCDGATITRLWIQQGVSIGFDARSNGTMTERPRVVSFFASIHGGSVQNLAPNDVRLPITMPMLERRMAGLER
jgi:hypothetical protein